MRRHVRVVASAAEAQPAATAARGSEKAPLAATAAGAQLMWGSHAVLASPPPPSLVRALAALRVATVALAPALVARGAQAARRAAAHQHTRAVHQRA